MLISSQIVPHNFFVAAAAALFQFIFNTIQLYHSNPLCQHEKETQLSHFERIRLLSIISASPGRRLPDLPPRQKGPVSNLELSRCDRRCLGPGGQIFICDGDKILSVPFVHQIVLMIQTVHQFADLNHAEQREGSQNRRDPSDELFCGSLPPAVLPSSVFLQMSYSFTSAALMILLGGCRIVERPGMPQPSIRA